MADNKHNRSTMRKSDSMCRRSARIVANIVRLSSLCLAGICLLPRDAGKPRRRGAFPIEMRTAVSGGGAGSKPWEGEGMDKSSWESRSSPASYLLESPYEEQKTAQVVREADGGDVNERATDYISKIRRNNFNDDSAAQGDADKFTPPPPRPSLPHGRRRP